MDIFSSSGLLFRASLKAVPLLFGLVFITPLKAESYQLLLSDLINDENTIIARQPPIFQKALSSVATLDNRQVDAIAVGRADNPANVRRVEGILSEADWAFIFPQRHERYTYLNFLKGVGKFPAFCSNYQDGRSADRICRTSLATMFAHFVQETGGHEESGAYPAWRQGLVYLREVGWTEDQPNGYGICDESLWQGQAFPCGRFGSDQFKSYFGRGAKQLSYNYNYGAFSRFIYNDVSVLLNEPERVADSWLNFASAVFFYLYPQPPKPSMLHVIDGTWQPNQRDISNGLLPGFGVTIQIINGGVECGGKVENQQSLNRIDYYRNMAAYLEVDISSDTKPGCAGMKQFDEAGAGALKIYWEQDWGYRSDTPDNKTYRCQLVSYQGPYSAFETDGYRRCVENKFDVEIIDDSYQ